MALVKYNNNSISSVTATAALASGAMTLIKSITASSDANISFVNGTSDVTLDSTYPIYCFRFINIHPETDDKFFQFNGSDDTSSHSYDITKTSTFFETSHTEAGSAAGPSYTASFDLAQSTSDQRLFNGIGNDNDQSASGELWLFNPSSTTYVKHFFGRITGSRWNNATADYYCSGYFNTTSAITAINFTNDSGDIDAGTIKLYGIKDS